MPRSLARVARMTASVSATAGRLVATFGWQVPGGWPLAGPSNGVREPSPGANAPVSARMHADCRGCVLEVETARADAAGPAQTVSPCGTEMDRQLPAYHLVRSPGRGGEAPTLDTAQQAVVDHGGGPLLVLAGPGTGKTTTIVETVADRITNRGIDPERVLVLTFSRKAAEELRERITARLHRTTREPLALTFHSYAYALVRREFVLAGEESPTLLSGPEQLLEVRRMLRGEAEDDGRRWPERLRPALATRGFATELRDFLLRAAERGLDGP